MEGLVKTPDYRVEEVMKSYGFGEFIVGVVLKRVQTGVAVFLRARGCHLLQRKAAGIGYRVKVGTCL